MYDGSFTALEPISLHYGGGVDPRPPMFVHFISLHSNYVQLDNLLIFDIRAHAFLRHL